MSTGLKFLKHKGDPNHSHCRFEEKVNEILDKHMPWEKLNKKEMQLQIKPWFTKDIIKSIKRRDKLLRNIFKQVILSKTMNFMVNIKSFTVKSLT